MSETKEQPKIFLSYASNDKDTALKIVNALKKRDVEVWGNALESIPGKSITELINKSISGSDYLLLLLSPNATKSPWVQYEISLALNKELNSRNITIIPILIADTDIPLSLRSYQFLDCRGDLQKGIERLVEQIHVATEIDFSKLDWKKFEDLVAELLLKLNFKNIEKQVKFEDFWFDIKADYLRTDPFGIPTKETWLAECKFYRKSRADVKTIQQFLFSLSKLDPQSHGLLVMNSQLTSVAQDYLMNLKTELRKDIRIIDGTELKRLLIKYKDLIEKYFPEGEVKDNEPGK